MQPNREEKIQLPPVEAGSIVAGEVRTSGTVAVTTPVGQEIARLQAQSMPKAPTSRYAQYYATPPSDGAPAMVKLAGDELVTLRSFLEGLISTGWEINVKVTATFQSRGGDARSRELSSHKTLTIENITDVERSFDRDWTTGYSKPHNPRIAIAYTEKAEQQFAGTTQDIAQLYHKTSELIAIIDSESKGFNERREAAKDLGEILKGSAMLDYAQPAIDCLRQAITSNQSYYTYEKRGQRSDERHPGEAAAQALVKIFMPEDVATDAITGFSGMVDHLVSTTAQRPGK